MPDMEYGKCDICGQMGSLARKYYRYNIKCECCNNKHFELVRYCVMCEPKPPREIHVVFKGEDYIEDGGLNNG